MNTGFSRTQHSLSEHPEMTSRISQLLFSFYRHRPIRADFSGGQISSDAGLLPLPAFDQRYGLPGGLQNAFLILANRSAFVTRGCCYFVNKSTKLSQAMRMPTTPIDYVTIRLFRYWPSNRWVRLSDHNQL